VLIFLYDKIENLFRDLDYISVMTYDNAGTWSGKTDMHSGFEFSKSAVEYYKNQGIPKEKLLMGLAFYGRTFTLQDPDNHKLGAPITKEGMKFPSGEDANAYYWEICDMVKHHGWRKEHANGEHDPYVYHGDQWIGYDDPDQIYQ
jgi:chitinase